MRRYEDVHRSDEIVSSLGRPLGNFILFTSRTCCNNNSIDSNSFSFFLFIYIWTEWRLIFILFSITPIPFWEKENTLKCNLNYIYSILCWTLMPLTVLLLPSDSGRYPSHHDVNHRIYWMSSLQPELESVRVYPPLGGRGGK